jgi:hypothetical protein
MNIAEKYAFDHIQDIVESGRFDDMSAKDWDAAVQDSREGLGKFLAANGNAEREIEEALVTHDDHYFFKVQSIQTVGVESFVDADYQKWLDEGCERLHASRDAGLA